MLEKIRGRLLSLLALLIPPRATQETVAQLSAHAFATLPPRDIGHAVALLPYRDERVRALIWELKYHHNEQALRMGAALLAEYLRGFLGEENLDAPLLIPLPMDPERKRARGGNHTERLCALLAPMLSDVLYEPALLTKPFSRPRQNTLSRRARLTNLVGSMRVSTPSRVAGRHCIVIDDVVTTGATFLEAARALREAGTREVSCVALAY